MEIDNISYKNTAFVAQDHGELAWALTEALRKRPREASETCSV